MTGFVALHLRRLREHPGRVALSVGGVAVGVTLMVATLGIFGSLTSSADHVTALSGASNLQVSAANDAGMPAELIKDVAAVDGVKVAAPMIRSQIAINGRPTLMLGFDRRSQALGRKALLAKCQPANLPERPGVVAGPQIERGADVRVASGDVTTSVEILARVNCAEARKINAGRFIVAPLQLAEELAAKPDRVDAIEIVAEPGTSLAKLTRAVERVVAGRAIVASPRLLAQQARTNSAPFRQSASVIVVLAMVVGGFCVFNTVSITALERRRELATLRAVGGSRRRLLSGFLLEMTVLGVIGSVLGAVLGTTLGGRLLGSIPSVYVDAVGVRPTFEVPRRLIEVSLALGTVVTLIAALMPARSAVRVPPVEAMRPEGPVESDDAGGARSVVIGVLGLVATVGGTVVGIAGSGTATLVGFGAITVGALGLTYALRGGIARVAGVVASGFGSGGRLAGAAVERAPRRTWATVTAVTVAVGTVVAVGGLINNQVKTMKQPFASMQRPDLWVGTAPAGDLPVNLSFDDGVVERLSATVPWIGRAVGSQSVYTTIGKDRVFVQGFSPHTAAPEFAKMRPQNQRRLFDLDHPSIVINNAFAKANHLKVKDVLTVPTAAGPLRLTVAEIVEVARPNPTGSIGMDLRLLEQAYGRAGVNYVEVYAKNGISRSQIKRLVERALHDSPTPAFVATGGEEYAAVVRGLKQTSAIFKAMQGAVLFATALALANALLISVVERRRELGIMRAVGTSRRQLRRMVVIESVAIAFVGTVIGLGLGLLLHRVGVDMIGVLANVRVDYSFAGGPVMLAAGATAAAAVLAALLPAARAANVNVIEAIGYE